MWQSELDEILEKQKIDQLLTMTSQGPQGLSGSDIEVKKMGSMLERPGVGVWGRGPVIDQTAGLIGEIVGSKMSGRSPDKSRSRSPIKVGSRQSFGSISKGKMKKEVMKSEKISKGKIKSEKIKSEKIKREK